MAAADLQRLLPHPRRGFGREHPERAHPPEHDVALFPRRFRVRERGGAPGAADDARERGAFAEGQRPGVFPEVDLRGALQAVGSRAEVDAVEVELQDLLLGKAFLDLPRQERLDDLPVERPFREVKRVAGKLLGDRARPLAHLAAAQVHERGTGDARVVQPGVRPEPGILARQQGVDKIFWHTAQRNEEAVFPLDVRERDAVRVVNNRALGDEPHFAQVKLRQPPRVLQAEDREEKQRGSPHGDPQNRHRPEKPKRHGGGNPRGGCSPFSLHLPSGFALRSKIGSATGFAHRLHPC